MVYYINKEIIDWRYDASQINKMYHNDNIVFGANGAIDYSQCLKFVATSNGTFTFSSSDVRNRIQYSTDNGATWSTAAANASVNVSSGDTVMWKGEMVTQGTSGGIGNFGGTASFNVQGNIMSLLYGDNFEGVETFSSIDGYDFYNLFSGTSVVDASNLILPATALTQNCYNSMFAYCSSLTQAPSLPATTLAQRCYAWMFSNCSSLTTAPELSALTLTNGCYRNMFINCTSLNRIKMLATDISASECLTNWVNGVAASGTFTKATSMTSLPSGANGIPNNWTVVNN